MKNKMRIALSGASGLVGSRIVELLSPEFDFVSISQEEVDITNRAQTSEALKKTSYDLFLHLAAYTNVDGAEKEREKAQTINVEGTRNVYDAVQQAGKPFIYISTDFVFSGNNPPYNESSIPHPISFYGTTKYEAEQLVKDNAMIVRFAYPYRAHYELKKDFVAQIHELLTKGEEVRMVTDSSMAPTFIDDIAHALGYLFTHFSPDIFHIVGTTSLSPFEAGTTIARVFGIPHTRITPISYEEYFSGRAKRPQYAQIISAKNTFCPMKSFEEGLREIQLQL